MTDENNNQPVNRSGRRLRRLRLVLILSLAVNLLIVGLIAGAALRNDGRIERRADLGPAVDAGLGPFGHAMTREQREGFRRDFTAHSGDLRRNRDEVRAQVVQFLTTLRSTPFDASLMRSQLVGTQDKLFQRQRIGVETLLQQIEAMSDAERAAFADRLEKSLRGMRRSR